MSTVYCVLSSVYCLLHSVYCLPPIVDLFCLPLLFTVYFRPSIFYCLLYSVYFLLFYDVAVFFMFLLICSVRSNQPKAIVKTLTLHFSGFWTSPMTGLDSDLPLPIFHQILHFIQLHEFLNKETLYSSQPYDYKMFF